MPVLSRLQAAKTDRYINTTLQRRGMRGFTLTELLVVIAIVILLVGVTSSSFNSIGGSQNMTGSTFELARLLDEARSYAMGKNTYVYVGITEIDGSKPPPLPGQSAGDGVGRVVVGIVSSQDGSRGYDPNASGSPIWTNYNDGSDLLAVNKLSLFSNLHLTDLSNSTGGNMARPAVTGAYNLASASCQSATPVAWPVGQGLNSGQYNFTKVIQFDPQGVARIIQSGSASTVPQWIEIGLTPAHGNLPVATTTQANQAAIQINGVSGAVSVYRP